MSGDEVLVLIASLGIGGLFWGLWNWHLIAVHRLLCGFSYRFLMGILPLACAGLLFVILKRWAAADVRDDARYLLMYEALGAAWVLVATEALPYLGYSLRDDVLERRNGAAAWAIAGALVALTLCFAGGNIGNGPGWWVVVFAAALSTAGFFGLWLVVELSARPSRAITTDRDLATGLRLAGLLTAVGIILGRGVAGDWVSATATLRDFAVHAWPALLLVGLAVVVERLTPRMERGLTSGLVLGVLPAFIYLGGATVWLLQVGVGA